VALIGTLGAIWLLGFSLNLLTLLALVLASGLVVDDSIVVLENIQRRRAQGIGARAAAVLGTREVFFAIVATTAALVSVFVPISFLPSTAGRLFAEFGFVMAIAVMLSSFVALSLGPMIAARLPAEPPADQAGRVQRLLRGPVPGSRGEPLPGLRCIADGRARRYPQQDRSRVGVGQGSL
jgi:multidrug efflux pump subunit AcrB